MSEETAMMDSSPSVPLSFVVATGATTVVLATALAYAMMEKKKRILSSRSNPPVEEETVRPALDRAQYPGGHLSIYFASQTGTSEAFGKQLEREGVEHGFLVHVVDLEEVQLEDFLSEERRDDATSKAIFLCSTYGEGEPTDNAAAIVMEMKQQLPENDDEEKKELDLPSQCLAGLEYCVFGLGNTQYEHYNAMGKFFDSSLEVLGGRRIAPIGLGDDDNDLEDDFEKWKDNVLWPTLKKMYIKEGTIVATPTHASSLPETPYVVEYLGKAVDKQQELSHNEIHNSSRHYFTAVDCPVTVNRELRSDSDPGSTVHIEIDISKVEGFTYKTADNLGVLPVNDNEIVEAIAKSLDYDLDSTFIVKAAPNHEWHGAPFPQPISVRECLARYCDLTSAPRRSDLKLLASYATDPTDKKALLRMSSKEAKTEYREKIMNSHVGLVDLLKLCPSIRAPLEHFLSFCPRLLPRYYTISSSSSVFPKSVHLTVSVTETLKKDGTVYKGVCSSYLANAKTVRIFNRDSTFRLPQDSTKPIIMIGPGTGVAPMRALLQERAYQRSQSQSVGPNILYFGCKTETMDYLYKDEIASFQADGILNQLYLAFSREHNEKVYVQHLLAENAKETWELVHDNGAYIYVCGGVKMGGDVSETLRQICVSEGKMPADDAKKYIDTLASEGRYVQELWA